MALYAHIFDEKAFCQADDIGAIRVSFFPDAPGQYFLEIRGCDSPNGVNCNDKIVYPKTLLTSTLTGRIEVIYRNKPYRIIVYDAGGDIVEEISYIRTTDSCRKLESTSSSVFGAIDSNCETRERIYTFTSVTKGYGPYKLIYIISNKDGQYEGSFNFNSDISSSKPQTFTINVPNNSVLQIRIEDSEYIGQKTVNWFSPGFVTFNCPTKTPTPSPSISPSTTPSPTQSPSNSVSPSPTRTASPSRTPSSSISVSPSTSVSQSPSRTQTPTASPSRSATPSASISRSASQTPSSSVSISPSRTQTPTPSSSISVSPSASVPPTNTPSPSTSKPLPPKPDCEDGMDIIFVLDYSASMQKYIQEFKNIYTELYYFVNGNISKRSANRIGLLLFEEYDNIGPTNHYTNTALFNNVNNTIYTVGDITQVFTAISPLSTSLSVNITRLDTPNFPIGYGTKPNEPIDRALDKISLLGNLNPNRKTIVIFVTDALPSGVNDVNEQGDNNSLYTKALELQSQNITVLPVYLGQKSNLPLYNTISPNTLTSISGIPDFIKEECDFCTSCVRQILYSSDANFVSCDRFNYTIQRSAVVLKTINSTCINNLDLKMLVEYSDGTKITKTGNDISIQSIGNNQYEIYTLFNPPLVLPRCTNGYALSEYTSLINISGGEECEITRGGGFLCSDTGGRCNCSEDCNPPSPSPSPSVSRSVSATPSASISNTPTPTQSPSSSTTPTPSPSRVCQSNLFLNIGNITTDEDCGGFTVEFEMPNDTTSTTTVVHNGAGSFVNVPPPISPSLIQFTDSGSVYYSANTNIGSQDIGKTVTLTFTVTNTDTLCQPVVEFVSVPIGLQGEITGPANICAGDSASYAYSDPILGAIWSFQLVYGTAPTLDSNTGEISTINPGSFWLVYTAPSGCFAQKLIVVNDCSVSQSPTPSTSISRTPTPSASISRSPSATPSSSISVSPSISNSASNTPTPSPSRSFNAPSDSPSPSPSATPTGTPSSSVSPSRSATPTASATRTPTPTPSKSNPAGGCPPAGTLIDNECVNCDYYRKENDGFCGINFILLQENSSICCEPASPSPTPSPSNSVSPSPSNTPSSSASNTPPASASTTPSASNTPPPSQSVTPSISESASQTPTPSPSRSVDAPPDSPSPTPSQSPTPSPSQSQPPSNSPTPSSSLPASPSSTPSASASMPPSNSATPSASLPPSVTPSSSGCPQCPSPKICANLTCVCPHPLVECNGQCVNISINPFHCGGCGIVCPSGQCSNGTCVPLPSPTPSPSNTPCAAEGTFAYYGPFLGCIGNGIGEREAFYHDGNCQLLGIFESFPYEPCILPSPSASPAPSQSNTPPPSQSSTPPASPSNTPAPSTSVFVPLSPGPSVTPQPSFTPSPSALPSGCFCGGNPYDCLSQQSCCNGVIYNIVEAICCNGNIFPNNGQVCCGSNPYTPSSTLDCCADSQTYNPITHECLVC